jgi:hypothetical protein
MKSSIKYISKFSLILCASLLPLMLYGQGGPGPPPPPEGIPFDMMAGFILAGAALFAAKRIYSRQEVI